MKKIYVAGPYFKGDQVINSCDAVDAGDYIVSKGYIPFIPHLCIFWHTRHHHDADYWYKYDIEWLKVCDALVRLPGESTGADEEVRIAKELGIPVYYGLNGFDDYVKGYKGA